MPISVATDIKMNKIQVAQTLRLPTFFRASFSASLIFTKRQILQSFIQVYLSRTFKGRNFIRNMCFEKVFSVFIDSIFGT